MSTSTSSTSTRRSWRPDHRTALLTALALADALGLFPAGMAIGAAAATNGNWAFMGAVLSFVTPWRGW